MKILPDVSIISFMFDGSRKCSARPILAGMSDLVSRVNKIELQCEGGTADKTAADPPPEDQFIAMKQQVQTILRDSETLVREYNILAKQHRGATHQGIQKSVKIRSNLVKVDDLLLKMLDSYRRNSDRRRLSFGPRWSEEESRARYDNLEKLREQADKVLEVFKSGAVILDNVEQSHVVPRFNVNRDDAHKPIFVSDGVESQPSTPDSEEAEAMQQWKQADVKHGQVLVEIGDAVDRIHQCAMSIDDKGRQQTELINMIRDRQMKTKEGISTAEGRIRQIIETERSSAFWCRIVMGIVAIVLVGWIMQRITKV